MVEFSVGIGVTEIPWVESRAPRYFLYLDFSYVYNNYSSNLKKKYIGTEVLFNDGILSSLVSFQQPVVEFILTLAY